eukprot:6765532-Pyramimonas_sp.AAC.1
MSEPSFMLFINASLFYSSFPSASVALSPPADVLLTRGRAPCHHLPPTYCRQLAALIVSQALSRQMAKNEWVTKLSGMMSKKAASYNM